MTTILRLCSNIFRNQIPSNLQARSISLFPKLQLKEIQEIDKGKEIIIKGDYIKSPREEVLVKNPIPHSCPLCSTGLELMHTDVLILSQFLRSDGCMLPRRETGLCRRQQKKVSMLVTMAQKAGLMPNLNPKNSKRDPKKRFEWKKYNKYFDESTIKVKC